MINNEIQDMSSSTKNCKVIPVFFGDRKRHPRNSEEVLEMVKYTWELEKRIDPGVDMDTIIVNNSPEDFHGSKFLNKIDGMSTVRGKVIVLEGDNIGISFGAHNKAFEHFMDKYEHWFFVEDDIMMARPGWYKDFINQLYQEPGLAFVAAVGLSGSKPRHAHSGAGCTNRKFLKEVYNKLGCLPHYKKVGSRQDWGEHIKEGEVAFTNIFIRLDYKVKRVKTKKSYIRWANIGGYGCDQAVKLGKLDSNSTVDKLEWGRWWKDSNWQEFLNER